MCLLCKANRYSICGEGQTKAQICPAKRKALLIPFSEQTVPWRARGDSGEIVCRISISNVSLPPYTLKRAQTDGKTERALRARGITNSP